MTPPASLAAAPLKRSIWATVGTLLPYLWPPLKQQHALNLRLRVVAAMLFLLTAKVANVYVPIFYKHAVDSLGATAGNVTAAIGVPIAIIAAYGLARVMSLAFGELRDAVFARVSERAIRRVAIETFEHLHSLSLRFHLARQTGGVTRALERGTEGIQTLLRFMLFNIAPTLVEIVLVGGTLWYLYGIWFALVTILTMVAYIAFTLIVAEWRIKYRRAMNENDSAAKSKALDSLLNYETVKYFGNEVHEKNRFDQSMMKREKAAVSAGVSLSLLNIGQAVIVSLGLTIIMIMAGRGVTAGTMTVGDFVLVNAYLLQLAIPLGFLGFVYNEIRRSLVDMEDMFLLLHQHAEIADVSGAQALALKGGSIAFEDVCFGYNPDRTILNGVSFTVPAGKTVAIVGPSGAGKSTISRLLFRFYEPTAGRITIDGQDIAAVTQSSLRAAIGIVPQDTVLFNDTIQYNIAYGKPGADAEEIDRAAKLARIDDFINSLPQGDTTPVGERGLKLSGGEKQRVAIARTILKNPEILLFDEATSALDSRTEQEIQASLREISAGRTTLVIAHRLSTIIDSDEILVLEAGRITERGSHRALLDLTGRYAEMWARQQEAAEEAADPAMADAQAAVQPTH